MYGLGLDGGSGSGVGRTQWSMYTRLQQLAIHRQESRGEPTYNYDQPAFQDTISGSASLIDKGYMPLVSPQSPGRASRPSSPPARYAWPPTVRGTSASYFGAKGIETGVAPLPARPERQARQHVQRPG